jgi:transposase
MIQRHEVQVLLDAGFSHRQVSKKTGVSKRSVTRIVQEARIDTLAARSRPRYPGRPSSVSRHEQLLDKILADEPGLLSVEILHRAAGRLYRRQVRSVRVRARPSRA